MINDMINDIRMLSERKMGYSQYGSYDAKTGTFSGAAGSGKVYDPGADIKKAASRAPGWVKAIGNFVYEFTPFPHLDRGFRSIEQGNYWAAAGNFGMAVLSSTGLTGLIGKGIAKIGALGVKNFPQLAATLSKVFKPLSIGISAAKVVLDNINSMLLGMMGKIFSGMNGAFNGIKGFFAGNVNRKIMETGGRRVTFNQYMKLEEEAVRYYEKVRDMGDFDIKKISENTGFSQEKVITIKNHVFIEEHKLESGTSRYDPDIDMMEAWKRLIDGNHQKQDIDLLQHEYFESKFEKIFDVPYRIAHDKTIESGRIWDPYEPVEF